jgi:hypothetical protein
LVYRQRNHRETVRRFLARADRVLGFRATSRGSDLHFGYKKNGCEVVSARLAVETEPQGCDGEER